MFSYLVRRRPRVLNINKKRRNWNVSDEFFSPPNNYHNRLSLYLHLPWLLQCGRLTNGESFASLGSSSREDNCFFFQKKVSRRVSVIIDRVVLVFFVSVCNHFSYSPPLSPPSTSPITPSRRRSSGWIRIEASSKIPPRKSYLIFIRGNGRIGHENFTENLYLSKILAPYYLPPNIHTPAYLLNSTHFFSSNMFLTTENRFSLDFFFSPDTVPIRIFCKTFHLPEKAGHLEKEYTTICGCSTKTN